MRAPARFLVVCGLVLGGGEAFAQDNATLTLDLAADEHYRRCQGLLGSGDRLAAAACFETVIEQAPESTAALKARAALGTLRAEGRFEFSTWDKPGSEWPFSPGHLELSLAAGGFGIWTGASVGAFLGGQGILPAAASATGGALAVGLGGAYGLGALAMAEFLDLKGGDARLLASGIGWGMALGLTLAPWVFALQGVNWPPGQFYPEIFDNWEQTVPPVMLVSAATGYLGAGLTVPLAFFLDLDQGQVSMINTGGWVGFVLGVLCTPILAGIQLGHPGWLGILYSATTGLGLMAGAATAFLLELEVWEVLIIDAATAAVALLAGGATAGAYFATQGNLIISSVATTGTGVATIGTLMASTAAVVWFRTQRGDESSRVGYIQFDEIFGAPTAMIDMNQQFVPGLTLVSGHF